MIKPKLKHISPSWWCFWPIKGHLMPVAWGSTPAAAYKQAKMVEKLIG